MLRGQNMNNEFYHGFSVGFNWWYVVGPLMVILMVIYGASTRKLNPATLKIRRRDKKWFLANVLAVVCDFVLHGLVLLESTTGALQLVINHLSKDDDIAWALILLIFGMSFTALVFYEIYFSAAKFGAALKVAYLKDKIRKIKNQDLGQ